MWYYRITRISILSNIINGKLSRLDYLTNHHEILRQEDRKEQTPLHHHRHRFSSLRRWNCGTQKIINKNKSVSIGTELVNVIRDYIIFSWCNRYFNSTCNIHTIVKIHSNSKTNKRTQLVKQTNTACHFLSNRVVYNCNRLPEHVASRQKKCH